MATAEMVTVATVATVVMGEVTVTEARTVAHASHRFTEDKAGAPIGLRCQQRGLQFRRIVYRKATIEVTASLARIRCLLTTNRSAIFSATCCLRTSVRSGYEQRPAVMLAFVVGSWKSN